MNNPSTPSALQAQQLCKHFLDGEHSIKVIDHLDFLVNQGDKTAIIGPSGSGKTTLLQMLGGLDTPTSGNVSLQDQSFSELNEKDRGNARNQHIGFVYQFHHLLPEFTAVENVAMPLLIRGDSPKLATEKAKSLLDKVGLADRLSHKPAALSGGERQRAAIARALVTNPACVLADEPTGNLDQENAEKIFELLLELNQSIGMALVLVTHDLKLANQMDQQFTLEQGKLVKR